TARLGQLTSALPRLPLRRGGRRRRVSVSPCHVRSLPRLHSWGVDFARDITQARPRGGRGLEGEDMDWSDSPDQAAFRAKVQSVIDQMPERYKAGGGDWERDRNNEDESKRNDARQWTESL